MKNPIHFNFNTDISKITIPQELNNPFGRDIPEITQIAAKEFQVFISSESQNWDYDFGAKKGKMFGVLVVQKPDNTYGFIGTNSGKYPGNAVCKRFVPSIFNDAVDDFFINRGMTELTEISNKIKHATSQVEVNELTEIRKLKSHALQQQLFNHYQFLNVLEQEKSLLQIFQNTTKSNPPSAAGECAAPKLLHYAFNQKLKPIAIAEFWWGNASINKERQHQIFYPACRDKCKPILEYMLNDSNLFNKANSENL